MFVTVQQLLLTAASRSRRWSPNTEILLSSDSSTIRELSELLGIMLRMERRMKRKMRRLPRFLVEMIENRLLAAATVKIVVVIRVGVDA